MTAPDDRLEPTEVFIETLNKAINELDDPNKHFTYDTTKAFLDSLDDDVSDDTTHPPDAERVTEERHNVVIYNKDGSVFIVVDTDMVQGGAFIPGISLSAKLVNDIVTHPHAQQAKPALDIDAVMEEIGELETTYSLSRPLKEDKNFNKIRAILETAAPG